ncbi:MAG: hypothetical protein IJF88_02845 [Oscillospiraceae bacterium]|nr:hypothetical protein [Oscillospiraceae bacterium]
MKLQNQKHHIIVAKLCQEQENIYAFSPKYPPQCDDIAKIVAQRRRLPPPDPRCGGQTGSMTNFDKKNGRALWQRHILCRFPMLRL